VPAPPPTPQVTPRPGPPKPAELPPPTFPSALKWSETLTSGPVAPPLVFDGRVIVALQSGVLSSRTVADGREVWTAKLAVDQPVAADAGRLFVFTGASIHALDASNGVPVWTVEVGQPTAPVIARGGWVIVASGDRVLALRAADGATVWTKPVGAISERPAIEGSALYLPLTDGRLLAMDLATGAPSWERMVGAAPTEPLALPDRVCLGSDARHFVCLDAGSGADVWRWAIGTRVIGPAAADDSRIYFVAMDNYLRAVSRGSGNQRWKQALSFRPTHGPAVMGRQVSVPGITGELIGFAATTGKVTGKLALTEKLAIDPALVAPDQADGVPTVVSITGGLSTTWTLSAAIPPVEKPPEGKDK
jgi:outer membrane protein assembly factor BamB